VTQQSASFFFDEIYRCTHHLSRFTPPRPPHPDLTPSNRTATCHPPPTVLGRAMGRLCDKRRARNDIPARVLRNSLSAQHRTTPLSTCIYLLAPKTSTWTSEDRPGHTLVFYVLTTPYLAENAVDVRCWRHSGGCHSGGCRSGGRRGGGRGRRRGRAPADPVIRPRWRRGAGLCRCI